MSRSLLVLMLVNSSGAAVCSDCEDIPAHVNMLQIQSPLLMEGGVQGADGKGLVKLSSDSLDDFVFPEDDHPALQEAFAQKSNSAALFSGGGTRSYTISVGVGRGLHMLGLTPYIKYIGGVSGGSQFTAVYTYGQRGSSAEDEDAYLCVPQYVTPDDSKKESVSRVPGRCMLKAVSNAGKKKKELVGPTTGYSKYLKSITDLILGPRGITGVMNMSRLHDKNKIGYPLFHYSLIAPSDFPPVGVKKLRREGMIPEESKDTYTSHVLIEGTPLYTGQAKTIEQTFFSKAKRSITSKNYVLGGFYENTEDIATQIMASSYATGKVFSKDVLSGRQLNQVIKYGDGQEASFMTIDGGCTENAPLISMLQRKVGKVIVSVNEHREVEEDMADEKIPVFLSSWFGVNQQSGMSVNTKQTGVFAPDDLDTLLGLIYQAQDRGDGVVVPMNMSTVANEHYGIPANQKVEVLWLFNARAKNWFNRLPTETQELLNKRYASSADIASKSKIFGYQFPNIPVSVMNYEPYLANLLANHWSWIVLEHKEIFESFLKP